MKIIENRPTNYFLANFLLYSLFILFFIVGCEQKSSLENSPNSISNNAKQKAVNAFINKLNELLKYQSKSWEEKGVDIKLVKSEFSESRGDIYLDDHPEIILPKYIDTRKGKERARQISAETFLAAAIFKLIKMENESFLNDFKVYIHLNDGSVWLYTIDEYKNDMETLSRPNSKYLFGKRIIDNGYNIWAANLRKMN